MEIAIASFLMNAAQVWFAALQATRDDEADREIDAATVRWRMLRQNQISIGVAIGGGVTHPNGGILKLSLAHTGPAQGEEFILIGGGALFAVGWEDGERIERELRIDASEKKPLILYPAPRLPPNPPIPLPDGQQATMRALVAITAEDGHDVFSVTGYVEEQDGSVYHGQIQIYRVADDGWYEPVRS